jgi:hypothetical protein
MAILTGLPVSPPSPGTQSSAITLNKADLITGMNIVDAYWSNSSNWERVVFQFQDQSTLYQFPALSFYGSQTATFGVSSHAQTSNQYQCLSIKIYDFDHGHYYIPRSSFTTATEFDVGLTVVPASQVYRANFANGGVAPFADGTVANGTSFYNQMLDVPLYYNNPAPVDNRWRSEGTNPVIHYVEHKGSSSMFYSGGFLNYTDTGAIWNPAPAEENVLMWVKLVDINYDGVTQQVHMFIAQSTPARGTFFGTNPSNTTACWGVRFAGIGSEVYFDGTLGNPLIPHGATLNNWTLLSCRIVSGTIKFYTNGVLQGTYTDASVVPIIAKYMCAEETAPIPYNHFEYRTGDLYFVSTAMSDADHLAYYNNTRATYGL